MGQIDNFLLTDCADCFSVLFRNNATIDLPLSDEGQNSLYTSSTYEFWWRTAYVMPGETYKFGDIFTLKSNQGDVTMKIVPDTEDQTNLSNARFELYGPTGLMHRIPESNLTMNTPWCYNVVPRHTGRRYPPEWRL